MVNYQVQRLVLGLRGQNQCQISAATEFEKARQIKIVFHS
jgi:hypothetical protein